MDFELIYMVDDLIDWDVECDFGYFGEFLYMCGVQSSVYRGKLWIMCMFVGFGSVEQINECFYLLLKVGQMGFFIVFDLFILMGYDFDYFFSKGEVGKCGVVVFLLVDMEILFQGIDFMVVIMFMIINSFVNVVWVMYIVNVQKQGKDFGKVGGIIQNDIFKEFIV